MHHQGGGTLIVRRTISGIRYGTGRVGCPRVMDNDNNDDDNDDNDNMKMIRIMIMIFPRAKVLK